jgi:hypothetical protein
VSTAYQSIPRERPDLRPRACQWCKLVNWPQMMDGTPRRQCHRCGAALVVITESELRALDGNR